MTVRAKKRWPFYPWLVLLIPLSSSAVPAQTNSLRNNVELTSDLRTVIILAGYACRSVMKITKPNATDYHVSCDGGRHYRVHISEERGLQAANRSDPSATGSADEMDHEDVMKRHLFSIVNLAGHQCTAVLSYERRDANDNIVTCEDNSIYRIHVTPQGRVAVDKQSVDK
jgi:hypothetical protein